MPTAQPDAFMSGADSRSITLGEINGHRISLTINLTPRSEETVYPDSRRACERRQGN